MRMLRMVVSCVPGTLPALVAVTLVPAACSSSVRVSDGSTQDGGASTSSGQGGAAGTGGSGGTSTWNTGGSGGTGGSTMAACPPHASEYVFTVEVPAEGVPADQGQICAAVTMPVTSNRAARVTLNKYSQALNLAMGFVAIEPALQDLIVGLPVIEVIDTWAPSLMGMQVSGVQPASGGFTFQAEWPPPLDLPAESWVRMTVKVTMVVKCDAQGTDTRVVESVTHIHLCTENGDVAWVSSGDECKVCEVIAEMAPSPIVPNNKGDDLPLGCALQLRVVPLARIGRALVLFAQNDGGEGLSYEWHASGGQMQSVTADVVVWSPPPDVGPHMVQAAVMGEHVAGVASYLWEEAA